METSTIVSLVSEMREELTDRILPYWMEHTLDEEYGGFVGRITQENAIVHDAQKSVILNARILWTFSAAYRVLGDAKYRAIADRAWDYIQESFRDEEYGGYFWMLSHEGRPTDARKHVYTQAFVLYGLSEYYRATGHEPALKEAIALFELIERYAHDEAHGGYYEAFGREWAPLDDVRLSDKDARTQKSMNTHLHVLEAYTNLVRVWPDDRLRTRLRALTEIFLGRILDGEIGHFLLFFDDDWHAKSDGVSYGHDIEASWLLIDAAAVVGDEDLRRRAGRAAVDVARVTMTEGQDSDGGLFNEGDGSGVADTDKHWWPQAEAVVGFLRAYDVTGDCSFVDAADAAWEFIKRFVIDTEDGEWYGRVSRDGKPYDGEDKVGPWKCPYHNARACLEMIEPNEERLRGGFPPDQRF